MINAFSINRSVMKLRWIKRFRKIFKICSLQEDSYRIIWQVFSTPWVVYKSNMIKPAAYWLFANFTGWLVKEFPDACFSWFLKVTGHEQQMQAFWIFVSDGFINTWVLCCREFRLLVAIGLLVGESVWMEHRHYIHRLCLSAVAAGNFPLSKFGFSNSWIRVA